MSDVGVNKLSIVTKKSGGKTIAFPDVCKTPSPAGPIPIPYPNIAMSSDLDKGTKNVKVNKSPVCLKGSNFKTSTGDEAGTAKGLISSKTKGKAEPLLNSFDVKMEGKGVVRMTDIFLANDKNTPPTPLLQSVFVPAILAPEKEDEEKCEYCGKEAHDFSDKLGNSIGSGTRLAKNICGKASKHKWYTGLFSLQAHHLICSEALDDDDWFNICAKFGYDVDRKENGVMLPYHMELACQLHVAMHRSNHSAGRGNGEPYPKAVAKKLNPIKSDVKSGKYCGNLKGLIDELDSLSEYIINKVDKFKWTLTGDGKDYDQSGIGCAGVSSVQNKPSTPCPCDRKHDLTRHNSSSVISKKSKPLAIGT